MIATVVGTLRVIGTFSEIPILIAIALTFGISPAPSPFDRVMNVTYGDMTRGSLIGCEDQEGNIKWAKWEHPMRSRVPGPHRRGVDLLAYLNITHDANSNPDSYLNRQRRDILTRYYYCENGTLARAAECPANLESIIFKRLDERDGHQIFHVRIPCTP